VVKCRLSGNLPVLVRTADSVLMELAPEKAFDVPKNALISDSSYL